MSVMKKKAYWWSDGCDIMVFDSKGHLLIEHLDVPREAMVETLNKLNECLIRKKPVEVPEHLYEPDKEFWDRMDETFNVAKPKLLPKPTRQVKN